MTHTRRYHPPVLTHADAMTPYDRRRLTAVVLAAIDRATRTEPDDDQATWAETNVDRATRAEPDLDRATWAQADSGVAFLLASDDGEPGTPKVSPGGGKPLQPGDLPPTYGNLPRDAPMPGERVILERADRNWREVSEKARFGRPKPVRAAGWYAYVIQDGKIYAVKADPNAVGRQPGHTEAARGGRVSYAGMVHIGHDGKITAWNNDSGHYRPAASMRQTAIDAGFPDDGTWQERRRVPGEKPQLPVSQPATKPRDGGPAKVPPGPDRSRELEARVRPQPPAAGTKSISGVTFSFDTKAADVKQRATLKSLDVRDYPPPRPGRVTGHFGGGELLAGLGAAGASAAASLATDQLMKKVESHFGAAADRSLQEAAVHFRSAPQMIKDFSLDVLENRADFYRLGTSTDDYRQDVEAYYDATEHLIDELKRYREEGQPIVADLDRRITALTDVGERIDETATWIITYMPLAYHFLYELWPIRDTFFGLAGKVSAVRGLVSGRMAEYHALERELTRKLAGRQTRIARVPRTAFEAVMAEVERRVTIARRKKRLGH